MAADLLRSDIFIQDGKKIIIPAITRFQLFGSDIIICIIGPDGHVFQASHQTGVESHDIQLPGAEQSGIHGAFHFRQKKRIIGEQLIRTIA